MSSADVVLHDLTFEPLLSAVQIAQRVAETGRSLRARYAGKTPYFISVLSGSFVFAADLIRAYQGPCEMGFVKLSSYQGTQSTGEVQMIMGLEGSFEGRDLIVVEDIVDSGRTLHAFHAHLKALHPASVCTVTLLSKPEAHRFEVALDYVCFEIPDRFVVGYGLDYDELGRNLDGIYVLKGG